MEMILKYNKWYFYSLLEEILCFTLCWKDYFAMVRIRMQKYASLSTFYKQIFPLVVSIFKLWLKIKILETCFVNTSEEPNAHNIVWKKVMLSNCKEKGIVQWVGTSEVTVFTPRLGLSVLGGPCVFLPSPSFCHHSYFNCSLDLRFLFPFRSPPILTFHLLNQWPHFLFHRESRIHQIGTSQFLATNAICQWYPTT